MSYQLSTDPKLSFSPVCRGLLLANLGVYVVGVVGPTIGFPYFQQDSAIQLFALSAQSVVRNGMFWTPLTYMFFHGSLLHIGANMMGLYLLGPDLEQALGHIRFLAFFLITGLAGALGYFGISFLLQGLSIPVLGASGAIFGLLGGAVALYPSRIYVILPLMIPVRASVLAVILLTTHVFFILTPYGNAVAYDVHLVGGVTGFALAAAAAWLHRRKVRPEMPDAEIPYACVELETLAYRLAERADSPEQEWDRYTRLRHLLRFEDIPSVDELSAYRRKKGTSS